MTPDRLADAIETLAAGPPWDTAWLHSLLPELAVRGSLAAQQPGDEPFPDWGTRTSAATPRLRNAGFKIPSRSAASAEVLADAPRGWTQSILANVGLIVGGGTPKSGEASFWSEPGEGVPWITPADLEASGPKLIEGGRRDISTAGLDESSARLLPAGTVLFSSRAPIGKVAISGRPLATNQGFKSCVPFAPESAEFVYLWLLTARAEIEANATGTTFKEISGKTFGQVPITLPPLAEQHRIVAKVDELMGHAAVVEERHLAASSSRVRFRDAALHALAEAEDHEAAETAWARIEEHFDDLFTEPEDITPLRQTILQLAVRGRLVAQDPGDEDAKVLINEIARAKQSLVEVGKTKKSKALSPVDLASQAFRVPDGWIWCRLGEITLIKTGKLDANAASDDGEYPFFTCAKEPIRINTYAYDCECVLLAGNGNFDVNYYDGKFEAYQRTYIIEPPERGAFCVPFLHAFMTLQSSKLKQDSIGGVIPYIRIGFLTEAAFPLPPLAEQHRIAAKIDELMALCDTFESKLARAKCSRERFATSVSHSPSAAAPAWAASTSDP